jgi:hypothetical protein
MIDFDKMDWTAANDHGNEKPKERIIPPKRWREQLDAEKKQRQEWVNKELRDAVEKARKK